MKNPKFIMITGASSGIGRALAIEYAAPDVTLFISGLSKERLGETVRHCEQKGAKTFAKIIDCRNKQKMDEWITDCDRISQLDLVIANAGISTSLGANDDITTHTETLFETNVNGVFNTVHPAIKLMKNRRYGQIAIVSSVAGMRGLPSSPAYSSSKVAVKAYGEALRGYYHDCGLEINVICPGFVRSRMTDENNFKMPFFMEADKAARIIRTGLEKNKANITFPWQMRLITFTVRRLIPEFILERLFRRLPKK
ncbi:MAG TPA: SDR family NAD(P)-dependent oxidoreductase [Emcibacteraceae bacterium]|nr:SDR family NAD(P)-dependent oxidoreductase [Emcibacteraceae bacterium]HRW30799.1 SDR family NAD(P)-dependent oxidoreductase [Emcibacteraceae bacterium]